jgi:hypothetical protein
MNRLLIHSNGTGDGYTPAVGTTAALTHGAASATASTALNGSSGGDSGPVNSSGNNNDVRRLQDEVNQLTKRNGGTQSVFLLIQRYIISQTLNSFRPLLLCVELMQQLSRAEQNGKEMSALMKKDFELSEGEKSQKIKEMEKSQRQWKQEKDELVRV